MKIETGKEFSPYFKPSYPEEFELFYHLETAAAIPAFLFAIAAWKENGKPNVCFHSWSCVHGDKTNFFAVMGNRRFISRLFSVICNAAGQIISGMRENVITDPTPGYKSKLKRQIAR